MEALQAVTDLAIALMILAGCCVLWGSAGVFAAFCDLRERGDDRPARIEKLYASARLIAAMASPETVARYYAARIPSAVWA